METRIKPVIQEMLVEGKTLSPNEIEIKEIIDRLKIVHADTDWEAMWKEIEHEMKMTRRYTNLVAPTVEKSLPDAIAQLRSLVNKLGVDEVKQILASIEMEEMEKME